MGATAVAYQTGRPPAAMAGLFARGRLTIGGVQATGCYPCESFDPEPIVDALRAHGLVMEVADLTTAV
jgi:saccharopine dehydrogenase-like NADP-dependent oxidoreductase